MIRNCDIEKYAHSMTNANISLPWSWKLFAVATRDIGSTRDRSASIRMANAIVDSPEPPSIRTPKMVEYQCGSSDMTQSTLMKVIVRDEQHEARSGNHSRPAVQRAWQLRGRLILLARPLVQEVGEADPDGEIQRRAAAEESGVQVRALEMQDFLHLYVVGLGLTHG